MEDYIIAEDYVLPSNGEVYTEQVNPKIRIRSMTTEEEMKRLSRQDSPYKMLSEIIDDCIVGTKPGISAYDMCIGDYQYLMYKLRTVTYGSKYSVKTFCPVCGKPTDSVIDLDSLKVHQYSEDLAKYLNITLPRTKKNIELRLQTPRMLDDIKNKSNALLKKSPNASEPAFLYTLESLIYKVDGQVLDAVKLESFVRHLPMQDSNYIMKSIEKIDIGIDTLITCKCSHCKGEYDTQLPITREFFEPSID